MTFEKKKVKLVQGYSNSVNQRDYQRNEVVSVEDNPNSDFFHVWKDNRLDVIPKNICEIVRGK